MPRLRMVRLFFFLLEKLLSLKITPWSENFFLFLFITFLYFSFKEYLRKAAPYVEGGYNDIDPGLNPALQDHYRITPSPGGPGDQYGTFGA